jgi:hypothetical protein
MTSIVDGTTAGAARASRSTYPAIEIPSCSLVEYVLGGASRRAGRTALVDATSGAAMTFGELERMTAGRSGRLMAAG